jgi:hypothetical protein
MTLLDTRTTYLQALKFGRGNKTIVGMISSEKETFDFRAPVAIEGAVEQVRGHTWWWLALTG